MSPNSLKRKKWCFTLNNYENSEYEFICSYLKAGSDYFIIGKEVGDSGTPHLQGYFILKEACTQVQVKAQVSQRAHFETARGAARNNRIYCSKGGDYVEEGACPGESGKRTRDELAVEWRSKLATGRMGITEFADDNPGVFAWSGHTLLRNSLGLSGAIPRPDISVRWIWGPPGVGKSRLAHEEWPEAYIKDPRTNGGMGIYWRRKL